MSTNTNLFEFAESVAPLYIMHNWLNLRDATLRDAALRVYKVVTELYDSVERRIEQDSDSYTRHSSGRVYVEYSPDPDGIGVPQIEVGLNLLHLYPNDDGEWQNIFEFEDADAQL